MKTNRTRLFTGIILLLLLQIMPVANCENCTYSLESISSESIKSFHSEENSNPDTNDSIGKSRSSSGDTVTQKVIASSGDFLSDSSGSISFTIGEPVIVTLQAGTTILTQGFQQAEITVTPIYINPVVSFEISAYPNPASDYVIVETENFIGLNYILYSIDGRIIRQDIINSGECEINFTALQPSAYILKVFSGNTEIKSYKIIKK